MKITDVRAIRLRAPIPEERQVFSRFGVRNMRSTTLIQVDTNEGITGLGSCSGNGGLIEVIIGKILKPLIVGKDPTQIDDVGQGLHQRRP